MSQEEFETLLRFFKALANENRLRMVGILANRECSVGELATLLDLREPTVSHHLAKLKALGLLQMRVERNDHLFRLNAEVLESMNKDIFTTEKMAALLGDVQYDAWERKVLNTFLEGDVIQAMPSGYKKGLAVLKWLVQYFEEGVRYTEKEVNAIILPHYHDYALLRREMVENGLMDRDSGIYWRIPWEMPEL